MRRCRVGQQAAQDPTQSYHLHHLPASSAGEGFREDAVSGRLHQGRVGAPPGPERSQSSGEVSYARTHVWRRLFMWSLCGPGKLLHSSESSTYPAVVPGKTSWNLKKGSNHAYKFAYQGTTCRCSAVDLYCPPETAVFSEAPLVCDGRWYKNEKGTHSTSWKESRTAVGKAEQRFKPAKPRNALNFIRLSPCSVFPTSILNTSHHVTSSPACLNPHLHLQEHDASRQFRLIINRPVL